MTFGAPMVLYGEDAPTLYASLQKVGLSINIYMRQASRMVNLGLSRACLQ